MSKLLGWLKLCLAVLGVWLRGPLSRSTWEVYIDVAGFYRWRLIAGNGEKVAQGEGHATRHDAIRAALTVDRVVREARRALRGVEGRTRL